MQLVDPVDTYVQAAEELNQSQIKQRKVNVILICPFYRGYNKDALLDKMKTPAPNMVAITFAI